MSNPKPLVSIHARVEVELHNQLENWRRGRPQIPSRADALRALLKLALKADTLRNNKEPIAPT
jgi:hypothetical protein